MEKSVGQVAYEAYCAHTNWKSLITGIQLPQWIDLRDSLKEAWEKAGNAAFAHGR